LDNDAHELSPLDEESQAAIGVIAALCRESVTETDLEKLVLEIDRQLVNTGFNFVSMTVNRLLDEETQLFSAHVITASTEYKHVVNRRTGVFREWKSGKVIYRSNLDKDLDGLPIESIEKRSRNFGITVKSTVNVPFSRGMLVLRSIDPEAFTEIQIDFLQRIARELSLAPICQA
jgi:hypothetical protein